MFQNIFKNKKVLLTGHTGFKGSWLAQWLVNLEADVAGLSLYIPSEPSHFDTLELGQRVKDYRVDINDFQKVQTVFDEVQPDILFHLAAQPIVSTSIKDPVSNFSTNVMGTIHLLEALRSSASVKAAVFITSDKCYENKEWEFGYRENDMLGGKDPYSASKACAEIAFHSYFRTYFKSNSRIQMATARAGNVIGGGDWATDRIVPDNVKAWGRNAVPVIRSPKATRPWQHVLEPLSGYLQLAASLFAENENLNGESFNFGPPADVNQTVECLLRDMTNYWPGKTWEVQASSLSGKEAGLLKLCCDKALARLNWKPTLTFQETVEFTAKWYRTYYETSPTAARQLTTAQIQAYIELARSRHASWCQ